MLPQTSKDKILLGSIHLVCYPLIVFFLPRFWLSPFFSTLFGVFVSFFGHDFSRNNFPKRVSQTQVLQKWFARPHHHPLGRIAAHAITAARQLRRLGVFSLRCDHQLEPGRSILYLPSGYLCHSHGKSPFLIGKPSINGPFSMAMLNNQRVNLSRLHSCYSCFGKLPYGFVGSLNVLTVLIVVGPIFVFLWCLNRVCDC